MAPLRVLRIFGKFRAKPKFVYICEVPCANAATAGQAGGTLANILNKMGANVIEVQHNQFRTLDRLQDVILEVHAEANGHEHVHAIIDYFYEKGYQVKMTY